MTTSKTYYLAIDVGASSGRHILGYLEDGKLKLEEIYRFENGFLNQDGNLVWDVEHLTSEIKNGIKECGRLGKIPKTIAIDTWGVDYVLLDENKQEILPAVCYRDDRTEPMMDEVEKEIPQRDLYLKTGIQKIRYNTIYQLYADKASGKLERAKYFLMMPSYLAFKLTGVIQNEYTIATTTAMVNAKSKTWDADVIERLGFPTWLFGSLSLPSTEIGDLSRDVQEYVGFNSKVIFAPSHDTASAVAAAPIGESDAYISSGTWSLIGIESKTQLISDEICKANFANEGGIEYRFRFLKNYMGMWLLQNVRKNLNKKLTYDELMNLAKNSKKYRYLDVNHRLLVAPENMIEAIREYFNDAEMTLEEVLASIYHSLAKTYKEAIEEIERLTSKSIENIHIVGGGCQDKYLNELTAQYTGKNVKAGPIEATAVGNLISQLIYDKTCLDLVQARQLVLKSC